MLFLVKIFVLAYNSSMRLEQKAAQRLITRKQTLAVAESCTGGLLSHRLTNIPGSSRFFKGGIIAYSNESKTKLLRVPAAVIRRYGAVSAKTATAMAQNARKFFTAAFGIGITGIAGPAGAAAGKPIGLVYIAVTAKSKTLCQQYHFQGNRLRVKSQAADQALRLLGKFLDE